MTRSGDRPPAPHLALDTSAYAELRRGHTTVLRWVASASVVDLNTVVLGELEAGFRLGKRYQGNKGALADFLDEPYVHTRQVDHSAAERYGHLFADLRRAGTPIPVNDIWIAAVTIVSGAHLVTFDTDFSRVKGLPHTVLK